MERLLSKKNKKYLKTTIFGWWLTNSTKFFFSNFLYNLETNYLERLKKVLHLFCSLLVLLNYVTFFFEH